MKSVIYKLKNMRNQKSKMQLLDRLLTGEMSRAGRRERS